MTRPTGNVASNTEVSADVLDRAQDELQDLITKGTQNSLDIASQYNFSPERVRLFRNGSRAFPQYNTVSQFDDTVDTWTLQPDAGDTMHIESAESGTYVVNNLMEASFAFQLNQSLQDSDVLRFGPATADDGWLFEQRGADHTATQGDIIELSGGTESTLEADVEMAKPTTDWLRYEVVFGWYSVLNQTWTQTTTDNGLVENPEFASTSRDGDRGPETGNLNLRVEVQADSGTSGLKLEAGSMAMTTLGDPISLTRSKPQFKQLTLSGTADAWEPLYAIRVDPDNAAVNSQLQLLEIVNYGANADVELVVVSFDASKTDIADGDWGVPDYHHADNSAIQSTTAVSQVADDSGTVKDLGTSDKFGGYTLASAVDIGGGNSEGANATVNESRIEKKSVLASDHLVFLARSSSVDSTLSFVWDVDQNW